MEIDWSRQADFDSVSRAASLLLRGRGGLESTEPVSRGGGNEQERLDRLKDALAKAAPAAPAADWSNLRDEVVVGARTGLAKLGQGEAPESFTFGEEVGLESVILTDGTRPSLFVQNGFVDLRAPDVGDWRLDLSRFEANIRKVTAGVGRIDVPVRPWFAGTCFVVAEGLVLTNRHVLEDIADQTADGSWTLKWPNDTTVDFFGEEGGAERTGFKVVDVAFAGPDPIRRRVDFAHLDAAILRVDAASDGASSFPAPMVFATDVSEPKTCADLYVVGFPAQPRVWAYGGKPGAGAETQVVITSLFKDKFGVKRLAPGSVTTGPGDAQKWICAHDASTLGGNSGSCVVDFGRDGLRVVGLHFAGENRERNWAHVAARLQDRLAAVSARFVA